MKYFTMEECIHSKVARERGIDNTPSPEIEAHITESVESLLDSLREAWEACSRKQGWNARHPDFIGVPLSGTEPGGRGKRDFCPPVWLCVRSDSAERTDEGIQGVLPGVSEGAGF